MTVNKTKKSTEPEFVTITQKDVKLTECTREKFAKRGLEKVYDDEFNLFGVSSFLCTDMSQVKVKDTPQEKVITNFAVKDCAGQNCVSFFSVRKTFYAQTRVVGYLANHRFDPNGDDQASAGVRRVFTHRIVDSEALDPRSYDVRMSAQIVQ